MIVSCSRRICATGTAPAPSLPCSRPQQRHKPLDACKYYSPQVRVFIHGFVKETAVSTSTVRAAEGFSRVEPGCGDIRCRCSFPPGRTALGVLRGAPDRSGPPAPYREARTFRGTGERPAVSWPPGRVEAVEDDRGEAAERRRQMRSRVRASCSRIRPRLPLARLGSPRPLGLRVWIRPGPASPPPRPAAPGALEAAFGARGSPALPPYRTMIPASVKCGNVALGDYACR